MSFPKKVKIVEVSPRDGLQNEATILTADIKIHFINQLAETGLSVIEATSFVSPKRILQLADAEEVWRGIQHKHQVHYPVLVPNLQGLLRALTCGVKEISVFTTASEQFSQKNTHCTVAESLERIKIVIKRAQQENIAVRAYLSCVLGCPYQGEIAPQKTADLAAQLIQMGCYEISLGDTIGIGTPIKTKRLLEKVSGVVGMQHLAVHFHDTYGQALVNIYAALSMGVAIVDSSVAGLGGCPYAKGASGNVASEDVVYMLQGMGIQTGVDLKKLIAAGKFISTKLGRQSLSKVSNVMPP